jgi:phage terminase large subunit GpA-like protein
MTSLLSRAGAGFMPPPELEISDWADQNIYVPRGTHRPGLWDTNYTPYLRKILDSVKYNESVVLMCSAQIGKTASLTAAIGYFIAHEPAAILFVAATVEMAEAFSKEKLAPLLAESPIFRDKIRDPRSRDSGNTLRHKEFPGGFVTLAGANSPAGLASRSIRVLLADDIDRFPSSAGTEGDPLAIAQKRTTSFWNKRQFVNSTPGNLTTSAIYPLFENSNQQQYLIPCPHCGTFQILDWERFLYSGKGTESPDFSDLHHDCANCDRPIPEGQKANWLLKGRWQAQKDHRVQGFHLWEAYSPWVRWLEIAQRYEIARKDRETLKVWTNTSLGLPWEETEGERPDWEKLHFRAEAEGHPLGTVPDGALLLTAGVDVQGDRLEVSIWGWGKGQEGWLIDYQKIWGDPKEPDAWKTLEKYLTQGWRHPSGIDLIIRATCIDSSYLTDVVCAAVRSRKSLRWTPIMGRAGQRPSISSPINQEISHQGKKVARGIKVWIVGVDGGKSAIYSRLNLAEGDRALHFPKGLDLAYFEGLCGEVLVTRKRNGLPHYAWEKLEGVANEPLDTAVYAWAAAHLCGFSRFNWDRERRKLLPKKAPEEPKITKASPIPAPFPTQKKGGFVSNW